MIPRNKSCGQRPAYVRPLCYASNMNQTSLSEHWAAIYWMIPDHAFDYSIVMRIGEDRVFVDGQMFYLPPF